MGRTQESLKIIAYTSSHNSEQDEIDQQLWDDLCKRIEELINETKYQPINPMSV